VLHYLSRRNDNEIVVAHLNHQIRSEANADALWVEELCRTLGVDCYSKSVDITSLASEWAIGLEEAGREARYLFFEDVRKELGCDLVAVAHHQGDLSEDVIMRFMRGTGWPGLSGMAGYDHQRSLIRPLLMLPKSTLIAFVKYLTINWCEDESNHDNSYTRNRVRHDILPLFLKENPNFGDAVGRMWKIGQIEQDYWHEVAKPVSHELSNELLNGLHKAVRLRLYKAHLDALGSGQTLAHTIFKLDDAWLEKRIGASLQFPGNKTVSITSTGLVFSLND